MFLDSTFAAALATAHRDDLIAQAERHRLARLVRSARRPARAAPPPEPAVLPERNVDADRRYAVSR